MDISKLGALWSLMTGGWTGLATYILEAVNKQLKKLDPTKLAQFAQVTGCVASALRALAPLLPEKYRIAVTVTIAAVDDAAKALADGKIEQDELDKVIDAVEAAIVAWKETK